MTALDKYKAKEVRQNIKDRWNAGYSYWIPLNEGEQSDILYFPQDYFLENFGLRKLEECLSSLNITKCYQISEQESFNEDYEINVNEIAPFKSNMTEKYYCTDTLDWLIYFSHENTVTIGGIDLINSIKDNWRNWKKAAFRWSYIDGKENPHIDKMIEILITVREKISGNTNLIYSGFDTIDDLIKHIDDSLNNLRYKNIEHFDSIKCDFLPTSLYQELSLDNNWGDEFIKLAGEFDKSYENWQRNNNEKTERKPNYIDRLLMRIKNKSN